MRDKETTKTRIEPANKQEGCPNRCCLRTDEDNDDDHIIIIAMIRTRMTMRTIIVMVMRLVSDVMLKTDGQSRCTETRNKTPQCRRPALQF